MPFLARYSDTCSRCKLPINIGDAIRWSKRDSAQGRWHASCDMPTQATHNPSSQGYAPMTQPMPTVQLPTTQFPSMPTSQAGDLASVLALAIQPHISAQVADLDSKVDAAVNKRVNTDLMVDVVKAIHGEEMREMGPKIVAMVTDILARQIPQVIHHSYATPTGTITVTDTQHALFPELYELIQARIHVYLFGDAGSGKSTAGIKAAELLGMRHSYISLSAQTPESRLMGYNDATGKYVETEFYKCYKDGGVFVIDEMDNASANLLTSLNSALENGTASFPCGIVAKHEDFILLATGNTAAFGANPMFPDRRPLDGAFRERFIFLEWNTDNKLEMKLATSVNPSAHKWVEWIQQVRTWSKSNAPRLLVSQRASIKGAKLLLSSTWSVEKVANMVLFKGIDADVVRKCILANPLPTITRNVEAEVL